MHVKKGDLVEMISGSKRDKGKRGKVLRVDLKRNLVKVEGMRVVTRHQKAVGGKPGGIQKKEAFFPACKVLPVDPKTDRPTRVQHRIIDGKKVRVAQRSGAVLDDIQA